MYKRAVVAIDGSETSEHAFDAGPQLLASESGAQLQPLDVVDNTLDGIQRLQLRSDDPARRVRGKANG